LTPIFPERKIPPTARFRQAFPQADPPPSGCPKNLFRRKR
jgi:hypothetical protein